MRKKIFLSLAFFFASSYFILFQNQASSNAFRLSVYNADILFPFSLYQGLLNPASRLDWVFGGYTPFFELLAGFIFWFFSRDIHATFILYAVFQPIVVTLSLLFLANRIVGNNSKIIFWVVVFSSAPMFLFSTGQSFPVAALFTWYAHITTACAAIVAFALLIQTVTTKSSRKIHIFGPLLLSSILIILSTMSDALFIAQFTVPAVLAIIFMVIFRITPFRIGAYAGLSVLYATAAGLELYRLPTLWGSERLALYGSYITPSIEQLAQNFTILIKLIPSAWGGSLFGGAIWVVFYGLCLFFVLSIMRLSRHGLGNIKKRLLFLFAFLLAQLFTSVGSGLTTNTPGIRYFWMIIFTPLFWGWPFILMAVPGWMKSLRGRGHFVLSTVPVAASFVLLAINALTFQKIPYTAGYDSRLVECIDAKAALYHLRRGMGNYWQARPVTLFSKTGLVVVQVDTELTPFRILNNSDGYRDDFDFVLISNSPDPGHWMDRGFVLKKFGQPAATFYCDQSEILVYNRESDDKFKNQFDVYFWTQETKWQ